MVKKFIFVLGAVIGLFNLMSASPIEHSSAVSNDLNCDAPAPDSFRVVGRGVDYVSLDWKPVSGAAGYYLEVYTRTDDEEWEYFGFVDNIATASTIIEGISFDEECKFVLHSKCTSNLVSIHSVELLEKIIIDLVVGGIMPINPIPLFECSDISLSEYVWVGFSVSHRNGESSESNIFEIRMTPPQPPENLRHLEVSRLGTSDIYAVDGQGDYPPPLLEGDNPVVIRKIIPGTFSAIGAVRLNLEYSNSKINICRALSPAWAEDFNFTVLGKKRFGQGGGVGKPRIDLINELHFNNPAGETLNITLNPTLFNNGNLEISIVSLDGRIIVKENIERSVEFHSFSLEKLANGPYLIQVVNSASRVTYKLMKISN